MKASLLFYNGGAIVTITLISLIAKIPCGSRMSEITGISRER
jgi:hypothetical protein